MQVGLECIGDITMSEISEVLLLAKKSLDTISADNILEISHLDITNGVLGAIGVSDMGKTRIMEYLGRKDHSGVLSVCTDEGINAEGTELICKLVRIYGSPADVIPKLDEFRINAETSNAVDELKSVTDALSSDGCKVGICIDFSLVGNMNYYNGIAFKGFIDGIPSGVLSGGQYDNLMRKMGRRSGAIGFAVYLDQIALIPDTITFPEVTK
jgi:ATP phosphoribosyltransferase regulatory subunit